MSKLKWDASLLRVVAQYLRVPELIYPFDLSSTDAVSERNRHTHILLNACSLSSLQPSSTLLNELQHLFDGKGSYNQANNLAFLLDRVFDVWLRKNDFPDMLSEIFSQWRVLFYKALLLTYSNSSDQDTIKSREKALSEFSTLLDSISEYARCWSPIPKRSQSILLDQLNTLANILDEAQSFDSLLVAQCDVSWNDFIKRQTDKLSKVSERLFISEAKKNNAEYSLWLAYHYLNVLFNKRELPKVLQYFLQEFWVVILAKQIQETLPSDIDSKRAIVISQYHESLDQTCKNIVRVFCHQGEVGFQLADQIIDDLQKLSEGINFQLNNFLGDEPVLKTMFYSIDEALSELSSCLLSLLQNQGDVEMMTFMPLVLPEYLINRYGGTDQFKNETISFDSLGHKYGDWFLLADEQGAQRVQLVGALEQSQQLLFCNYLGMKAAQFNYEQFSQAKNTGLLKQFGKMHSFSEVFSQALKGLSKVAENQRQARLLAAEKAKAEAEKLLEDRRKAEELSALQAEEIAQRTQQLLAKRADKLRLEKEKSTLEMIRSFKLGAWIALNIDGEPQRFKLVVKLAATGKYVFVDRLGVKRREFLEPELIEAIQADQVMVLSDGAEFEDSLQRVVSRLRISK